MSYGLPKEKKKRKKRKTHFLLLASTELIFSLSDDNESIILLPVCITSHLTILKTSDQGSE